MSWTRVGVAVACLAVLAPVTRIPALGALAVLAALLAGLNLVEASLVRRIRRAYAAAQPAQVDTTVH